MTKMRMKMRIVRSSVTVSPMERGTAVTAKARREDIVHLVNQRDRTVGELSRRFDVSRSTIRRDLVVLAEQGQIGRAIGGAMPVRTPLEATLQEKELTLQAEKDAIAREAASRISDGDTIFLDAGTTTARLAGQLRDREGIRVITNGINIPPILAASAGIEVLVPGGRLRRPSQALVGSPTVDVIRRFTADKAFIGCDGITIERGLSTASIEQVYVKEAMMACSHSTFILADHSKVSARKFDHVAAVSAPYTIITDERVSAVQLEPFQSAEEIELLVAEISG